MVVIIVSIHKITEKTLSPVFFWFGQLELFAVGHLGLNPAHPFASCVGGEANIRRSD